MIFMEDMEAGPTLQCQEPEIDDNLPLNAAAPQRKLGTSSSSGPHIVALELANEHIFEYWIFSQAAQASYLLHQVIQHMFDNTLDPASEKSIAAATKIDAQLQSFLLTILKQPRVPDVDVCGTYSLVMT